VQIHACRSTGVLRRALPAAPRRRLAPAAGSQSAGGAAAIPISRVAGRATTRIQGARGTVARVHTIVAL